MATRTIANGGGNWNSTGTWVEGFVPTSADAVVATATSGNLTVDITNAACSTFIMTNYVGLLTIDGSNKLTVTTTVTLVAGMTLSGNGTLKMQDTATITSGGLTIPFNLAFDGGTWTLADNWTTTGSVTCSNGTNTLNGNTLTIGGGLDVGSSTTTRIAGTTAIVMNGTGTIRTYTLPSFSLIPTSYINNNITINTAGTITFGTVVAFNRASSRVFTYTAGTLDFTTNSSTFFFYTATVHSTLPNMSYNHLAILVGGSVNVTLTANLSVTKLYLSYLSSTVSGTMTMVGNYDISCVDLYVNMCTIVALVSGYNLNISNSWQQIHYSSAILFGTSIKSKTSSSTVYVNYSGTLANLKLANAIFTDVDASGSAVPILNWFGGILTRTTNIYNVDNSHLPVVSDVKSGVDYVNGALTGTYAGGGSSNDVFGIIG